MKLRDIEIGKVYQIKSGNYAIPHLYVRVLSIEQGKYPDNTTENIKCLHCNYIGTDPEIAKTRWHIIDCFAGMLTVCDKNFLDFEETYNGQFTKEAF